MSVGRINETKNQSAYQIESDLQFTLSAVACPFFIQNLLVGILTISVVCKLWDVGLISADEMFVQKGWH